MPSTSYDACVVAAPGDGISPALLLTVGGEDRGVQYLFAAPEGYARLALEHKVRPGPRLRAIFTTSTHPRRLGGLGGLVMRLRADGHGEVRVLGPPGTALALAALRHIVSWRHPKVFVDEDTSRGGVAYADDIVEVVALCGGREWTRPAWLGCGCEEDGQSAPAESSAPADYELFPPDSSNPVYARAAVNASPPPSSPFPLWGWLVRVRPAAATVLIVDAADAPAAQAAASHPINSSLASISCVIHLTHAGVAAMPSYVAWAQSLACASSSSSPHILAALPPPSHPASAWVGHRSAARTLARLSAVDAAVFPGSRDHGGGAETAVALPSALTPGRLLLRVRGGSPSSAPPTLDASDCPPPFEAAAVRDEASVELAKLGIAVDRKASVASPPPAKRARHHPTNALAASALRALLAGGGGRSPPGHHPSPPTLTFLGTGSAEPSAHRGASALFFRPKGDEAGGLLLDAGEGTAGALARADTGASVTAMWISHRHADHCLGVAGVLAEAGGRGRRRPIPIVGPHAVRRWLADLAAARAVDRGSFTFTHASARPPLSVLADLHLSAWTDTPAIHCSDAHSLTLDGRAGWRLAVSGDSVPNPAFEAAAAGSDVLVHEATFGCGRESHAAAKKHATVAGALALAQKAAATRTVLTHFSQRYPDTPPDAEDDPQGWEAAGAAGAVDGMVVELSGPGWVSLPAVGRAAVAALVGLRGGGGCGGGDGGQGGESGDDDWDSS